jgi:hypothetical protein
MSISAAGRTRSFNPRGLVAGLVDFKLAGDQLSLVAAIAMLDEIKRDTDRLAAYSTNRSLASGAPGWTA